MRTLAWTFLTFMLLVATATAVPKPHVISFGKASLVKWFVGSDETQARDLKIRPLLVDGRVKESTVGSPHDITDRLFVIQRAFRINDALGDEPSSPRLWKWERGGWLLVDRVTGRISAVTLPEFDPSLSSLSWYRDYAAYCGLSEDGKRVSAVVTQLGRRKPFLKKPLGSFLDEDKPECGCAVPMWQRQPARVTFNAGKDQEFTFSIRGHVLEMVEDEEPTE